KPVFLMGRDQLSFTVRLTNLTGHKLPTGYPEGRRVYLEVALVLTKTATMTISGAWDPATGNLVDDPQLKTYETLHGRVDIDNPDGVRTHHVAMMNQIPSDTRIPPEGFAPSYPDMVPSGRDYGERPPYRNYDDTTYTVTMPDVTATST